MKDLKKNFCDKEGNFVERTHISEIRNRHLNLVPCDSMFKKYKTYIFFITFFIFLIIVMIIFLR